jgi:outer membrane protein assembly factor BamB
MIRRPSLAILFAALTIAPASADNWPQWRGPKNDGHSTEKGLPTQWSTEKNVLWKIAMPGRGSSTPCVWEDNIFLTSMDGDAVVLMCIGTDGKVKWKKPLGSDAKGGYRRGGGEGEGDDASASCSTDGKLVWAFAGTGKLACFDFAGKQIWEKDLRKYGKGSAIKIQFGIHWTPVLYKGRIYLQVMHRNAQRVVCLDALTGQDVWNVERPGYSRGESPDTYASAFMWEGEGGPLFVAHGNDFCTGHKLDDGAEVWRVAGLNPVGGRQHEAWRFVASPLVTPRLIVVPSCKDGPVVGFNPVGAKGNINPENPAEMWRLKFTPDVVSPLLVDDIVYLMKDGPLYAIDARTGTTIYQKSLEAKQRVYRGNMVYADGKIYIVGVEGIGVVVEAGRKFKQLAANELKEKTYASPAISNGRIYIRTWGHLYCIGTK